MKAALALSFVLAASLALSKASYHDDDDVCSCWEKCLEHVPTNLVKEYGDISKLLQAVRMARITHGIHGTGFIMDYFQPSPAVGDYQKMIAALVALTSRINHQHNPFFKSNVGPNYAFASGSWQCQKPCDAAQTLLSENYPTSSTASGWINGGCYQTGRFMDGWPFPSFSPCFRETTSHRMAVAFLNSGTASFNSPSHCDTNFPGPWNARVMININGLFSLPPTPVYPQPNPTYNLEIPYTSQHMLAAKQIYTCIRRECCDCCPDPTFSRSLTLLPDEEDVEGRKGRVKIAWVVNGMEEMKRGSFNSVEEFLEEQFGNSLSLQPV